MRGPATRRLGIGTTVAGVVFCLVLGTPGVTRAVLNLDDWVWRTPVPQGNPLVAVTWGARGFVAVGGGGSILRSADGVTWSPQDAGTNAYLSGVAWSGSGYVAVGSGGTILTSPDGSAWTAVASGVSVWLRGVRSLGGMLIAVGDGGTILTSATGQSWTRRTAGVPPWVALKDAALMTGVPENRYVVVGDNGTIAVSPDAVNWTVTAAPTAADLNGVACSGARFVAVGTGGETLTSADGLAWTREPPVTAHHLASVTWSGTRFCAMGDYGTILTSPDGTAWVPQASGAVSYLRGVVWSGSQFCGVGDFGMIVTSYDGADWTQQTAYADVLSAVAWSGTRYCIVGDRGAVLTSADGSLWTPQNSGTGVWLSGVAFGNGAFVAVGDGGVILRSADGAAWEPQASGTTAFLSSVRWCGDWFLAVGELGTVLTSPDGAAWTIVPPVTAEWYSAAAWSGALYVVVGSNGTVVTSPDGLVWTRQASGTTDFLSGIVWTGTQFVAVGSRGTVLTSNDGAAWAPQVSGTAAALSDIVWADTVLVAAGAGGALISSPDGIVWTQHQSRTAQWLHGLHWSGTQVTAVGSRGTISVCATAPATLPSPSWLAIDLGAAATRSRTVQLYNTCSGSPTHYMASESPDFAGAVWIPYLAAPLFELSPGDGQKTVYFRVWDGVSESIWISDSILLDSTPPSAVLSSAAPDPTRQSPFPVTISFSEAVTGFGLQDVLVTGGSASGLTELLPGRQWQAQVTPDRDGTVSVQVPAGAAQDAVGNPSTASNALARDYDGTAPAIALLTPANQAAGVAAAAALTITFTEPVAAAGGTVSIRRRSDGAVFAAVDAGSLAVSDRSVTIPHPDFAAGVEYYIEITPGCLADAVGNPFPGIAGPLVWSFTVRGWRVSFQVDASLHGTVDGALEQVQFVAQGENAAPVLAIPDPGYHLDSWVTDLGQNLGNENPLVFGPVGSDRTIRAVFVINRYTVTFVPGPDGTLQGQTFQQVVHGGNASPVTAIPDPGYSFLRWTRNGGPAGTANPLTVTNVTADQQLLAEFQINSYTVAFLAGAHGSLTGQTLQVMAYGGQTSPVYARPDFGYSFAGWDDGSAQNPRTISPVDRDLTLTALFAPGEQVAAEGTFTTQAGADEVAAGRGLWDFSGSYTVAVGAGSLRLNLVQDGSGRVRGTGSYTAPSVNITFDPAKLTGSVKGAGNDVVLRVHASGKQLEPGGKREEVVVVDLEAALNAARTGLEGVARVVRGRRSTAKSSSVLNVTMPLPAGMNGTYAIGWDLTARQGQVTGDALLRLSNGTSYLLGVRGRQTAPGQPSSVLVRADSTDPKARGIRFGALLGTLEPAGEPRPWWATLSQVKGKALGQTLAW